MTKSRTTRKAATSFRVDTLLLANYGILQPTRLRDSLTVNAPSLESLTEEDKLDLFEFAHFLMSDDRQYDFRPIPWPEAEDEGLRDEV